MAKRAKKKRGPKPKYLDITCPNPKCKQYGEKRSRQCGLQWDVSNPKYREGTTLSVPNLWQSLLQPYRDGFLRLAAKNKNTLAYL